MNASPSSLPFNDAVQFLKSKLANVFRDEIQRLKNLQRNKFAVGRKRKLRIWNSANFPATAAIDQLILNYPLVDLHRAARIPSIRNNKQYRRRVITLPIPNR